jgi:hypothetical protein
MTEIFSDKALEFARERLEKMAKKFSPERSDIILAFYFSDNGRLPEFKEIALKYNLNRKALLEIISRFRNKIHDLGGRRIRILKIFENYRAFYFTDYLDTIRRREKINLRPL